MPARPALAIEIARRRMRAIVGVWERGALRIARAIASPVPEEIPVDDPDAIGTWLRDQLGAAGFPRGRATLALAREHVGLKRLALPTTREDELPEMTRLALQREMPFDAERAVIDFVIVERGETSTTVLAVAAPADVLAHTRRIARAAGLGIDRIALRTMGIAALLHDHAARPSDGVLVIDVTGDVLEFTIISDGTIRFSRATEVHVERGAAADPVALADAAVTETRRTWMSYRIVEDAGAVREVVLLGDRRVTSLIVDPVAEILGATVTVLEEHPRVTSGRDALDRVWPLVGLLLEPHLDLPALDFAAPRRPVDTRARTRRRSLIAAGVLVTLLLGAWTVANRDLDGLRRERAGLETRYAALQPALARYQRDAARLTHIERWESVQGRWLAHLDALRAVMPGPGAAVLDGWSGRIKGGAVRYDRKERAWSVPAELSIVVEGEARDRRTADALRGALVRAEWYEASSAGSEAGGGRRLPIGFTYRLRAAPGAPPAPDDGTPPDEITVP